MCRHVNHFTSHDVPFQVIQLQAASKSVAMVCTPKGMMAVIDALAPPGIITKVPMPSVLTR